EVALGQALDGSTMFVQDGDIELDDFNLRFEYGSLRLRIAHKARNHEEHEEHQEPAFGFSKPIVLHVPHALHGSVLLPAISNLKPDISRDRRRSQRRFDRQQMWSCG